MGNRNVSGMPDEMPKMLRSNFTDLEGMRFCRLLVVYYVGVVKRSSSWVCQCDCGRHVVVAVGHLKSGNTRSCGCLSTEYLTETKKTHGMSGSKEHYIWLAFRDRCKNPLNKAYRSYGGRGISVCKRWDRFENFYADMGPKPEEKSLDRIDNDGGYSPENCSWATRREQNNNTRTNKFITVGDDTLTVAEWSRKSGIHKETIQTRLRSGWSDSDAVTRPVKR